MWNWECSAAGGYYEGSKDLTAFRPHKILRTVQIWFNLAYGSGSPLRFCYRKTGCRVFGAKLAENGAFRQRFYETTNA